MSGTAKEWTRCYDPAKELAAVRRINRDERTNVFFTEYLHGGKRMTQEDTWQLADDVARLFAQFTCEAPRLYFPKFGELHIDGRPNLRLNAKLKKAIRDAARRLKLDTQHQSREKGDNNGTSNSGSSCRLGLESCT